MSGELLSAHRPRMRDVAALVAERHGLSLAELKGPSATRRVAWPRQEAYALIRKHCPNISYPQIGQFFGGRDHTTVLYGVRAHEARVAGMWGQLRANGLSPKDAADVVLSARRRP